MKKSQIADDDSRAPKIYQSLGTQRLNGIHQGRFDIFETRSEDAMSALLRFVKKKFSFGLFLKSIY
jgi:hypothetical protein